MSPARPPPPSSAPLPSAPPPHPLDAVRALLSDLPAPDLDAQARVAERLAALPLRGASLGALADLALRLSGWTGGRAIARPLFALYVATYDADPAAPSHARAVIAALAEGGGAVGALARPLGAGVEAFDLALDRPVRRPGDGAPLTPREAAATLAFGMEAVAKAPDILVLSDAVEGSAAVADALAAALDADAGRDALDLLATDAGREVSALAGAILAARVQRTPVVLESPAALAAAAVLAHGRPGVLDHAFAAAPSPLQARLGLPAVTGLEEGLEPGVAGAAALALLKLASAFGAPA